MNHNYAKAGGTEDWEDSICVDVETNCMVLAHEVNCAEGWAIIMVRVLGSKKYIYATRLGHFRLMRISTAKKLGIKLM